MQSQLVKTLCREWVGNGSRGMPRLVRGHLFRDGRQKVGQCGHTLITELCYAKCFHLHYCLFPFFARKGAPSVALRLPFLPPAGREHANTCTANDKLNLPWAELAKPPITITCTAAPVVKAPNWNLTDHCRVRSTEESVVWCDHVPHVWHFSALWTCSACVLIVCKSMYCIYYIYAYIIYIYIYIIMQSI